MYDEKTYRAILDNLYDGVYIVDRDRKIVFWNKGAERISGFPGSEVVGTHCFHQVLRHVDASGTPLCDGGCPLSKTLEDGLDREVEIFLHHYDGHRVAVQARVTPIMEDGRIVAAAEVFTDNFRDCPEPDEIANLQKLALLDPLTGIANRRLGETQISSKLSELERHDIPFGLIFMDLDGFKRVNDAFGHDMGDESLLMVTRTLTNNLRSIDILSRWGGEEFVAVIPHMDREDKLKVAADRLRVLVGSSSIASGEELINITVSMGATLARPDDTAESIVERADQLMYKAKKKGGNCVVTDSDE